MLQRINQPPARSWWPTLRVRSAGKPRFLGLDAVRGLAVIGMVIAHTAVIGAWGSPTSYLAFVNGRSAIAFATVAGVSLTLMSGGATRLDGGRLVAARVAIVGRAIVLLVLSGLLTLLGTSVAIILASYALWFIIALPALRWRTRTLLIAAGVLAASGQLLTQMAEAGITAAGGQLASSPESGVVWLLIAGTYPSMIWMGFVFAGMAIGRAGLANTRALVGFLIAGLVLFIGFAAPFVIQEESLQPLFQGESISSSASAQDPATMPGADENGGPETTSPPDVVPQSPGDVDAEPQAPGGESGPASGDLGPDRQIYTLTPHSGSLFEAFSSGGLAMAAVAGFVLLGRVRGSRWLLWPLIGVGSMSLTAYCAHIVAIAALAPTGSDDNWFAVWLVLGLVVACAAWRALFVAGPLEQLTSAVADRLSGRRGPGRSTTGPQLSNDRHPQPLG